MSDAHIERAMAGVVDNLKSRTGRDLAEWLAVIRQSGIDPLDQQEVRRWLRDEHGVLLNSRWHISFHVAEAAGWVRPDAAGYTESQFSGAKAHLRPIYDVAEAAILSVADDISIEGRATYTPFVHRRQFALLAASTRTRVDLGLRFTSEPNHPRLLPARNLGMCTHRIPLASPDDVTDDLLPLIRLAYEENG